MRPTYAMTCPWCHQTYQTKSAQPLRTCGRTRCVREANVHNGHQSHKGSPERFVSPEILNARGPAYHHCGNPLKWGTNGNGYAVEWCGACGVEIMTPRHFAPSVTVPRPVSKRGLARSSIRHRFAKAALP